MSEQNKNIEKLHSDTFPAFAAKALLIIQSSLDQASSAAVPANTARMSVPQKKRKRPLQRRGGEPDHVLRYPNVRHQVQLRIC